MRKDVQLFSSYLSNNYNLLKMEVSKIYALDIDIFHDCILDLYSDLSLGLKLRDLSIKGYILDSYRKYRNKEISKSYTEKVKEDSTLEFIDNKTNSTISYSSSNNVKDIARVILSKNDFLLFELYYYQRKSKKIISLFLDESINKINRRIEYINNKLLETIEL